MGRGNKYYTEDNERYRQAVKNLEKKYSVSLKLREKIYGFQAVEEHSDDCRNAEDLASKCHSIKEMSKFLYKLEKGKYYICSFCNRKIPTIDFPKNLYNSCNNCAESHHSDLIRLY